MGFLGVYRALYDYKPQAEGELDIVEGDLLYVLEKSTEDDWWKAKKKAKAEDEDEPVGLIPNNYIEQAQAVARARALYEYTRQTEEELSFPENAQLEIFDSSDPDWILVGHDGEYGFVPANYIDAEDQDAASPQGQDQPEDAPEPGPESAPPALPARASPPEMAAASPPLPSRSIAAAAPRPASPPAPNPAAALAGVMAGRSASSSSSHHPTPPRIMLPPRDVAPPEQDPRSRERSPPLPTRPRGNSHVTFESMRSPGLESHVSPDDYSPPPQSAQLAALTPGGYHMYNINEMVSVMGKNKKMPTTLGVNLRTGIILIAPEKRSDGPSQEWSADRMTHYSREGKHIFMELVRPSKSIDFHAGAKDTAEEIMGMLSELAGPARAGGLRELILAGSSGRTQRKGVMVYDFVAQGDDEVTVAIGDEVIILDDSKSEEWWQVRRLKNSEEGVVPSSYIEVTGTVDIPSSLQGTNAGLSTVEQNRLEEARLTKQAVKAAQREDRRGPSTAPERGSSKHQQGRSAGAGKGDTRGRSKPDPSRVRTWTDRTKSFSVEAQFLGIKDGKLNLHKVNGVKIAVPAAKMSHEDLEYVERVTGLSLDDDRPLADAKRRAAGSSSRVGATIEKKPEYDWFQFFLACDIAVGLCERYAQAFARDSMDESVLPDVNAGVLRTLGLREGDIIKVMRVLDNKFGWARKQDDGGEGGAGGLFSGPGGTLRNNTRKGRPAPPVETNNVVDANSLSGKKGPPTPDDKPLPPAGGAEKPPSGFEDDAWDVKPSKAKASEPAAPTAGSPPPASAAPAPAAATVAPPSASLTGSMQELSLLTQPLQPEKVQPAPPPPALQLAPATVQPTGVGPASAPSLQPVAAQPTGASPSFFGGMQPPNVNGQATLSMARQRPLAPQYTAGQGGLMPPPPPPARPLSAPQVAQPSAFSPPPLQPHTTGYNSSMSLPQVAPPGQSLNELTQQRLMQQQAAVMPTMTGMPQQQQPIMSMMTGMPQQAFGQPQQPFVMSQPTGMMNGAQQTNPGPFGLPPQPTGFGTMQQPNPTGAPGGGVNSFLQPTLEPQRTGHFTQGFGNAGMPTTYQQPPLAPQQTGPPPLVRFGVTAADKKLAAQPTGRRANLSQATPQNPFGF